MAQGRFSSFEVFHLKPLRRTAVFAEHFELDQRIILEDELRGRGAMLYPAGSSVQAPEYHPFRLYILPDHGPWPLLHPGWKIVRFRHLRHHCDLADLQAMTARAMAIPNWTGYNYPLPNRLMLRLVQASRPEPEAMSKLRWAKRSGFFYRREQEWFYPDAIDGQFMHPLIIEDCYGYNIDFGLATCISTTIRHRPPKQPKRKLDLIYRSKDEEDEYRNVRLETKENRQQKRQRLKEEGPVEAVLAEIQRERRSLLP